MMQEWQKNLQHQAVSVIRYTFGRNCPPLYAGYLDKQNRRYDEYFTKMPEMRLGIYL